MSYCQDCADSERKIKALEDKLAAAMKVIEVSRQYSMGDLEDALVAFDLFLDSLKGGEKDA